MQKKIVEKFKILFPHISITSAEQHEGAQNYVIEINHEWMCKVAKPNTPHELFATEITLLNFLKNKLSTSIPEIIFHDETFLVYKKLHGTPLTAQIVETLNSQQKEMLAHDIAHFLHELHQQNIHTLDLDESGWPWNPQKLELYLELLSPYQAIEEIFHLFLKEYTQAKKEITHIALIHNDMNYGNILLDQNNRLCGVIDFTDSCIDDIWFDLRIRFNNNPQIQTDITEIYCTLSEIPFEPRKIWIYYLATEFSRFIQMIQHNDIETLPVISERITTGWQEIQKI